MSQVASSFGDGGASPENIAAAPEGTTHPGRLPTSAAQRGALALRVTASSGFTLLEMLIVLVIIGLLASLIGPSLFNRLDESKVTTAQTQVHMLKAALDTLRLDLGRYPTTAQGLALLTNPPSNPELRARWRGPYLDGPVPDDPWGHPFKYVYLGSGHPPFSLYSYGPEGESSSNNPKQEIGIVRQR